MADLINIAYWYEEIVKFLSCSTLPKRVQSYWYVKLN